MKLIMNSQEVNINEMQSYIPVLLDELRREGADWDIKQIRVFIYVLSNFYRDKIKVLPNEYNKSDVERINLDHLSRKLKIPKNIIIELTNIPRSHFARYIEPLTYGLKAAVVKLPNLDDKSKAAYTHCSWFIKFKYNDTDGYVDVEIDPDIFPYLIIFCNYTRIKIADVMNFKHSYSFDTYMMLKLKINKYNKKGSFKLLLNEYKESIGLHEAYSTNYSMFKKTILTSVIEEINKTDLDINIDEEKTGKKVTCLVFNYQVKVDNNQDKNNGDLKSTLNPNVLNTKEKTCVSITQPQTPEDQESKTALLQLRSYGILQNQASDLINKYGVVACKIGVERLLGEIDKGNEIKNISGYLIKCIQSQSEVVTSDDLQAGKQVAQEIEEKKNSEKMARFQSFNKYIQSNEQDVLVLLHHYKAKKKLTNANDINMLECLKDAVSEYIDLKDDDLVLTTRFDSDLLYYNTISDLVSKLKVATNKDRIALLKTDLDKKKQELDGADDSVSPILEKEISMIQAAIVDLI